MYENDGWTIYDSDNNKDGDFVYSTITCMAVDAKNNVWVGCKGSFGQGVRMFDGHKWTIYNRDNTPIKSSVYCIFIV